MIAVQNLRVIKKTCSTCHYLVRAIGPRGPYQQCSLPGGYDSKSQEWVVMSPTEVICDNYEQGEDYEKESLD